MFDFSRERTENAIDYQFSGCLSQSKKALLISPQGSSAKSSRQRNHHHPKSRQDHPPGPILGPVGPALAHFFSGSGQAFLVEDELVK
jgi:hypothetical protein